MRDFSVIVAATQVSGGIGFQGSVPWNIGPDLKMFKERTTTTKQPEQMNAVVMGRKTWDSIPVKFKPLKNRLNVVISKNAEYKVPEDVILATSLQDAFEKIKQHTNIDQIFIIGGAQLYEQAMLSPYCKKIYWTQVFKDYRCDVHIPNVPLCTFHLKNASEIFTNTADSCQYQFLLYKRKHEEYQYLDLISQIITCGNFKPNRTDVPTFSQFGHTMKFNLRDGRFPLFTTKQVFFRGIAEELLWFISGKTDGTILSNKRIKIWNGNGSREFLDKLGLTERRVGDLGPIYSHQWRHFGDKYIDCDTKYYGYDQLSEVINTLKTDPNNRRMIVSAWNPPDLKEMALPPCHVLFQFYVFNGELSCMMYQRSADLGLGVPFNIASYSLLTHMVAQVCGYTPGDFIHVMADTHVYTTHIEKLKEQIKRMPNAFPLLKLNPEKKNIDDFEFKDFTLVGYEPHDKIEMEMVV